MKNDNVENVVSGDQVAGIGVELMVDLETLATVADTVVTEIGAVMFDGESGKILDEFSYECDVDAQLRDGRRVSASTLRWYQDKALRISGLSGDDTMYVGHVLSMLCEWIKSECAKRHQDLNQLKVWAKGGMDCSILDHVSASMGLELPWRYGMVRDLRTYIEESGVSVKKVNVPHEGLADCKIQVSQLMECRRALAARPNGSARTDTGVVAMADRYEAQWCGLLTEIQGSLDEARLHALHSVESCGMVRAFEAVQVMVENLGPRPSEVSPSSSNIKLSEV